MHGLKGVGRFGARACADDEQAGRHWVQRPRVAHLQGTGVCFSQVCENNQVGRHWVRWLRETHLQVQKQYPPQLRKIEQTGRNWAWRPGVAYLQAQGCDCSETCAEDQQAGAIGLRFSGCPSAGTSIVFIS